MNWSTRNRHPHPLLPRRPGPRLTHGSTVERIVILRGEPERRRAQPREPVQPIIGLRLPPRRLADTAGPVSFEIVASQAGVYRSWLYANRTCVPRSNNSARTANPTSPRGRRRQRASETSLLRRLEAATDRMRHLEPAEP